jgi:hypothetical protein
MPDTLNGVYSEYLEDFGPESAAQPAALRDRVMTMANNVPKVFAMMQDTPVPRIVFVHRPTRFAPSWNNTQPWDDDIYGFQGDVQPGNQINMIEWPVTPFGRTAHTTVPALDHMDAAWTTAIGNDALGPFNANDPNTEQVRARFLCPIPHPYVPLCIGRTYTPRTFWTDVIGQIAQNQQLPDCAVLVDWARVASTYGPPNPAGQHTTLLGGGVGTLRIPLADDSLSARRWEWLCADLPALGHTATPLEGYFVQQTAALDLVLERQVD